IADKVDDGFVERTEPGQEEAAATAAPAPAGRAKREAAAAPAAPAAAPPPEAPAAGSAPPGVRHFELVAGTSSKFWEVWVSGQEMSTRYGRIGSQGQTTTKAFADPAKAEAAAANLVA